MKISSPELQRLRKNALKDAAVMVNRSNEKLKRLDERKQEASEP